MCSLLLSLHAIDVEAHIGLQMEKMQLNISVRIFALLIAEVKIVGHFLFCFPLMGFFFSNLAHSVIMLATCYAIIVYSTGLMNGVLFGQNLLKLAKLCSKYIGK